MTNQSIQTGNESQLKVLQEENELLLDHLHRTQEELERCCMEKLWDNEKLHKGKREPSEASVPVEEQFVELLAERIRLKALVDAQRKVYLHESKNALNVKLGNILIEGATSTKSLLAVPRKLWRIWRESSRKRPPAYIGGKNYSKIIELHRNGGFRAVDNLFHENKASSDVCANAYTALARQLMNSDRVGAATAAWHAYSADPKSYRLKWFAFRLHEAGETVEADATLDLLPPNISYSESEARHANMVRYEALQIRRRVAKQKATPRCSDLGRQED